MTLKLVEDFAIAQVRKDIRDSLQWVGEQAIVLAVRHETSDGDDERCPLCSDDVYHEGEWDCTNCFGTRFADPIKHAAKVWAVFSDTAEAEQYTQRGVWAPVVREIQTEPFPQITEHDFVIRVRRWTRDGRVAEVEGFYGIQQVLNNSVRTGNRFGQYTWDVTGQRAKITELSASLSITRFPVLDKTFDEPIIEPVGSLATPPPTAPDTKVVYVPIITDPVPCDPDESDAGEPLTPRPPGVLWRQVFFFHQRTPAATWTIRHPFDYNPSVTLFVGGEEADTDVEFPDDHTAVLIFATPQSGTAELI